MGLFPNYGKRSVTRMIVWVTLCFAFNLAVPLVGHATPLPLRVLKGTDYRIVGSGPPILYTGQQLLDLANAGSHDDQFKYSIGALGLVVITAILPGAANEPSVTIVGFAPPPPGGTAVATLGVLPGDPEEHGFGSLDFTGLSTDESAGGSQISIGILGGDTATYDTALGDTASTVFANLLAQLLADGINAYQTGDRIVVLGNIYDPTTMAGAFNFTSSDADLQFNVEAGTVVPEPAPMFMVGSGLAVALGLCRRRILQRS